MPGMDGRELATRLTATAPSIQVLFISGYTSGVIAETAIQNGELQFLHKPFRPDELLRRVREIIQSGPST